MNDVREQVHYLLKGATHVYVTGHSLGAALAEICAMDLKESFPSMTLSVVTFGTPRIGNAALAEYYNGMLPASLRVAHYRDVVPHLPPHTFDFWTHTAHETWWD